MNSETNGGVGRRYKMPKLTKLEYYVHAHEDASPTALANELCRPESAITAAYNRACNKLEEREAIVRWVKEGRLFWVRFGELAEEVVHGMENGTVPALY